jgi:hypothetical protein
VEEIAAEDYNCNIRRYVDNAPPPEPHDVRAHLHGGVPVTEIDALAHFWHNYPGLRERCFVPRETPPLSPGEGRGQGEKRPHVGWVSPQGVTQQNPAYVADAPKLSHEIREKTLSYATPLSPHGGTQPTNTLPLPPGEGRGEGTYADFAPEITDRRAITERVKTDPGIAAAQTRFLQTLEAWWTKSLPLVEALAPSNGKKGNVYALRRALLTNIEQTFANNNLLTGHQIRGAFARYVDDLKADLKSIAASGWGPELIPDTDILASQFPEMLADNEQKRLRIAELTALFAAADEEDYEDSDDSGVLPGDEVKTLKAEQKQANAEAKLAKREKRDATAFLARAQAAGERLARHKALEDEAKQLKAELRATEKKQEELVAAAREKISTDEAKGVILERLHRLLVQTYEGYLRADQRACIAALENLHGKYAVTAKQIEAKRDEAAAKLKGFLVELGYE